MPGVRRHVRVVLNGRKYDVETNALDMVKAEREGEGPIKMGMRTVHAALVRTKAEDVPPRFDAFLESLDDFEDLDEGDGSDLDPTNPAD